jgi:hypothetical protein
MRDICAIVGVVYYRYFARGSSFTLAEGLI